MVLLQEPDCQISYNSPYHRYPNVIPPKREINSCLRSVGKLQSRNAPRPMLVTLAGMTMSDRKLQPSNA